MWYFREMGRSEMNEDPIQGEFFAPEEGYPGALIRESIQNSLDARRNGERVDVRFSFSMLQDGTATLENSTYFTGLLPHLRAQSVANRPESHEQASLLLIEDFGTRGLQGNPEQSTDVPLGPGEPKNDFFYFWRNVGRSIKAASERGRWGLGKTVFPASSRVHSFFGLTVRAADGRTLLMGQSVGKIHMLGETKHAAYGYFAQFAEDGFALPFEDQVTVDGFRGDFSLQRQLDQPGLSIAIPFPRDELSARNLLNAAIRNYYIPILFGDLGVTITRADECIVLDQWTIRRLIEEGDWSQSELPREQMRKVLDFAERVIALSPDQLIVLRHPGLPGAPSWNDVAVQAMFAGVDLPAVRERFEREELIGLRVPVNIQSADGWTQASYFDAFLQRDPELATGQGDFVRQGLTISQVDRPPKAGIRGLVFVNDLPLSTLLGDSENPAHTKWQERAESLRTRYRHGAWTVRFVTRSLMDLSTVLSRPPEGQEEDLLVDLFYVQVPPDEATASATKPKGERGEDKEPGDPPPKLPARVSKYLLTKVPGGFRLASNPAADVRSGPTTVQIAYAVKRGNPFKKYQPFDFVLGKAPIRITHSGVEVAYDENVLEVTPIADEFSVEVAGFDPHRDLVVRTGSAGVPDEASI